MTLSPNPRGVLTYAAAIWQVLAPTVVTGSIVGCAIWVSFGSLAATADTGRRIGLLPSVWMLALSITALVALFWRVARVKRVTDIVAWSAVVLLPWLPVPVPDAFLIWTGPLAGLLWTAIGLCALPRLLPQINRIPFFVDARVAPRVGCALAFVAFLAVHHSQPLPPAGDEPHYLLITQSLLHDHDLKVSNNYEQADYQDYYPGLLRPHYARPAADGSLYSLHGPGLPLLIAPAFAIGGYRAVVLWIAAIAALGTMFVWKAAHALTSDVTAAWVAWVSAALTMPAIIESTLVYPDAVAGTVLSAGVLAMLTSSSFSLYGGAALGIAISLLPWLHTRFAPLAGTLAAVLALRCIGTPRDWRRWFPALLGMAIPIVVSVIVWLLFSARVYGTLDPRAPYAGGMPLQPDRVLTGLLGLVADQEFGLVPNAPVHLLWIGAAWVLARQHKRLLVELACVAVPYVLAVAAFPNWFGGSTPARYIAPLVFPLAITIAPLWCAQDHFGRCLSVALLTTSALLAFAFGFGGSGMLAYNSGEGRSALLDWVAPVVNLPGGFPSYLRAVPADGPVRGSLSRELVLPATIWFIVSLAIWFSSRWIHNRCGTDRLSRSALAAATLLAVITLGVATTWEVAGVPQVVATRAQLGLIAREDPRVTPLGVQLWPLRTMSSTNALQRLVTSTSVLDTPPQGTMLRLSEVPPGEYRLRVRFKSEPRGTISLLVGSAGGPLATWQVAAPDNTYSFPLPIRASTLTIAADPPADASIRSVALIPVRHITTPWASVTRARGAARYGRAVVYAIDNRIVLEPDGFWVLGGRQPDIVFTVDGSQAVTLRVLNVAVRNRVRVSTGGWSATRELAPGEPWLLSVPFADSTQPALVNVRADDGASVNGRFLGCHISVVE